MRTQEFSREHPNGTDWDGKLYEYDVIEVLRGETWCDLRAVRADEAEAAKQILHQGYFPDLFFHTKLPVRLRRAGKYYHDAKEI